ncbi:FtsX-like permease family protein [Haladaptatus sp. CMAA 1909]|uniref:FtsX-like permease family protein n=2 Tax=unclassified Haladaptatus TaxID=2622732 RepID=UPI003754B383
MVVQQYPSYATARQNATKSDLVFPLTTIQQDGENHTVVGVPESTPSELSDLSVSWRNATIPVPPDRGIRGAVSTPNSQRIQTRSGDQTSIHVSPYETDDSIFPRTWYVANPSTVQEFGETGALVIRVSDSSTHGQQLTQKGTITPSLSAYFLRGMREVLHALTAATIAASALILVVLYNVTKMSVRDRIRSIAVIRSTGGTARRLIGIFSLRSGLLGILGCILGVVIGVGATRAVVEIAIYLGMSFSLDPSITPSVVRILLVINGCLVGTAMLAGASAAWSTVRQPPAQLNHEKTRASVSRTTQKSWRGIRIQPRLLSWRAVIPTATTLTVFALIIILSGSLAGVLAPLATASTGTVTEPGAPYPMASRIETQYATALRDQGIEASPEIIAVQVADGKPYLARGANYSAFAAVSNADLVTGHSPQSPSEAVIGEDLAQTLNITTGDTVLIGGSTSPAFTRVRVVGVYRAPGMQDDQLIFPLETAHTISTKPGTVQFIRTAGDTPQTQTGEHQGSETENIVISSMSAPEMVGVGQEFTVSVGVQNIGTSERTRKFSMSFAGETQHRSVTLQSGEKTTVKLNSSVSEAGNYSLTIGPHSQSISVYQKPPLVLPATPEEAPPGAEIGVAVRTITEQNVSNAKITIGDTNTTTNEYGLAKITLPETPGTYELTASKGNRTKTTSIQISSDATRHLVADIDITPDRGTTYTKPEALIRIANPWSTDLHRNVSLVSPLETESRIATIPAYSVKNIPVTLEETDSPDRIPPGRYTAKVVSNGTVLATDTYVVTGDAQIQSSLTQNTDFSSGSGLGQAVEVVFGNFKLLIAGMMLLAGLTTIGSTTATFAQEVHARRQAIGIHRATGATRCHLLKALFSDVVRISIPASIIAIVSAFGIMYGMSLAGMLTIFGIQLTVMANPFVIVGTIFGAFLLSCLSVSIAVLPLLMTSPSVLQSGQVARSSP